MVYLVAVPCKEVLYNVIVCYTGGRGDAGYKCNGWMEINVQT